MKKSALQISIEQLQKFSIDDADAIRNLTKKLGSSFQPLSNENLKEMIASPTLKLLVARAAAKKQIVGMATLAIYRIPYLKKAYLDDFVVESEYQGQGIGSLLIKKALSLAEKSHASYIEFTSNPKRTGANQFYQKQGFEMRDTNVYRMTLNYDKA